MNLSPLHQQIWKKAVPYLINSRLFDLWHTEKSIAYMQRIISSEKLETHRDVLIPAIILHDIGWSAIGKRKNSDWTAKDLRIKHMEIGAKLANNILTSLSYNKKLIDKICHLVATHDNAYLGIK